MKYKTLQIEKNSRENIVYKLKSIPLVVSIEYFDDYFQREWSCHWHNEFEFGIVLKGIVKYEVYDGQKTLSETKLLPGEGIFINAGRFHSTKGLAPNTVMLAVAFPTEFFDTPPFDTIYHKNICPVLESGIEYLPFHTNISENNLILLSLNELYNIDEEEKTYELHCLEIVCKVWRLLIAQIESAKKEHPHRIKNVQIERLQKIISFIHSHYSENINIENMAKISAISRTEVFRCFHSILQKTPIEYLTEYRLSIAATLLKNTDKTLADISLSCGFNNPSYFGKVFREQCGLSPKKYREHFKKQNIR